MDHILKGLKAREFVSLEQAYFRIDEMGGTDSIRGGIPCVLIPEEMTDKDNKENIIEENTDRLHTLGADYLICNLFVIFGGGAAAAVLLFRDPIDVGFIPRFLCMSLVVAILWLMYNINAGNPHSIFYRVISKTIDKNREKYGFDDAYLYRGYSGTILIDTEDGRIAYLSNLSPRKFQIISAIAIGKISVSHVPYVTNAFTTYVYFQFYHKGKKIRIPTYASNGNGRPVTDKEVKLGITDAGIGAEKLREAKQAALMREGKKNIDHSSIVPNDMCTIKIADKKQVVYSIENFEDTVRKALQDIEAGREKYMVLTPQEPVSDIKAVKVSSSADPKYLFVDYVLSVISQSCSQDHLTVMDALSICTELFLKRDPRQDG